MSQLLRDVQRLKPQPFALLSFTRAGGTILFLSWACAMLLLPAQTWPWTTWDLSLVFHPVTIHASLNWGLLVDSVQGSRPLWWRENGRGSRPGRDHPACSIGWGGLPGAIWAFISSPSRKTTGDLAVSVLTHKNFFFLPHSLPLTSSKQSETGKHLHSCYPSAPWSQEFHIW